MIPVAALSPDSDFVTACYIVAFSLFILGIQQGTHPRTARRGNLIAAAGMLIAIAITLSLDVIGNGALILAGILIGTAVGGFASYRVQMTDMPQMVALYNGVGGGAASASCRRSCPAARFSSPASTSSTGCCWRRSSPPASPSASITTRRHRASTSAS